MRCPNHFSVCNVVQSPILSGHSSQKPPRRRMKNLSPATEPTSISSLPYDVLLDCLARISKSYYPTLSLVSKSFRSLLASPELYETRSLINRTESCLYVCLQFPLDENPRWFILCRRPDRSVNNDAKKKKKPIGYLLVSISSPSSSVRVDTSSVVAIGSEIYEIGGYIDDVPSSIVSVLDCRSNTWREGPRMQVERSIPSANVVDGKIYVVGGRSNGGNFSGWIEVFDPNSQTWKPPVSSPGSEIYLEEEIETLVIDGQLYIYDSKGVFVSYNPKDGTCEPVESSVSEGWSAYSYCVINNVLFYYDNYKSVFKWYNTKLGDWRILKGLKKLPKVPSYADFVNLVDYDGNMVVFWYEHLSTCNDIKGTRIWCAEIALKRSKNEERISGKIVWFDVVLEVPICCETVRALVATV